MRLEEDLVIRRSRPTMISPKYRAREERRRLLKISAGKLRKIEDPETSLCRSVLINNAVRRLQRENRDERARNYTALPTVIAAYMDDTEDTSSRKRLADDDTRNDEPSQKRQRHDDLVDDMLSDFYILPPTPRLLSHINEMQSEPTASHHGTLHLSFPEDRLSDVRSDSAASANITSNTGTSNGVNNDTSCHSVLFPGDLDDANLSRPVTDMMEVDPDRLCDFARFDPRTLEERLVELQQLDEHFELTKFERNNNQSCGRAIQELQTFHSLVPGLET